MRKRIGSVEATYRRFASRRKTGSSYGATGTFATGRAIDRTLLRSEPPRGLGARPSRPPSQFVLKKGFFVTKTVSLVLKKGLFVAKTVLYVLKKGFFVAKRVSSLQRKVSLSQRRFSLLLGKVLFVADKRGGGGGCYAGASYR